MGDPREVVRTPDFAWAGLGSRRNYRLLQTFNSFSTEFEARRFRPNEAKERAIAIQGDEGKQRRGRGCLLTIFANLAYFLLV
mgnify:FL=1